MRTPVNVSATVTLTQDGAAGPAVCPPCHPFGLDAELLTREPLHGGDEPRQTVTTRFGGVRVEVRDDSWDLPAVWQTNHDDAAQTEGFSYSKRAPPCGGHG